MKIFRLFFLLGLDSFLSFLALYLSYSLVYQEFVDYKNINLPDFLISSFLLITIFFISKIYFYRSRFLPKDIFSLYFKHLLIYLIIFLYSIIFLYLKLINF